MKPHAWSTWQNTSWNSARASHAANAYLAASEHRKCTTSYRKSPLAPLAWRIWQCLKNCVRSLGIRVCVVWDKQHQIRFSVHCDTSETNTRRISKAKSALLAYVEWSNHRRLTHEQFNPH